MNLTIDIGGFLSDQFAGTIEKTNRGQRGPARCVEPVLCRNRPRDDVGHSTFIRHVQAGQIENHEVIDCSLNEGSAIILLAGPETV